MRCRIDPRLSRRLIGWDVDGGGVDAYCAQAAANDLN